MNFTLPIASSSEAKNGELEEAMPKNAGGNEPTWVKSRLEGSQSIVLEHVEKCLNDLVYQTEKGRCITMAYCLSGIVQA